MTNDRRQSAQRWVVLIPSFMFLLELSLCLSGCFDSGRASICHLSSVISSRVGSVPGVVQHHQSIAAFRKPGHVFRLDARYKKDRLSPDYHCGSTRLLAEQALFSLRTSERQILRWFPSVLSR